MDSATIYADGRMSLDGCVPNDWRVMGINANFIVYHSPGSSWSANGFKSYGPASIEVREVEDLRPGNEPGTWRVKMKRLGRSIHFHPTPKVAAHAVSRELPHDAPRIMGTLAKRRERGE